MGCKTGTKWFFIFSLAWVLYQPKSVCYVLKANKPSAVRVCFLLSSTQFSSNNCHLSDNHILVFFWKSASFQFLNHIICMELIPMSRLIQGWVDYSSEVHGTQLQECTRVYNLEREVKGSAGLEVLRATHGKDPSNDDANPEKSCANYKRTDPWHCLDLRIQLCQQGELSLNSSIFEDNNLLPFLFPLGGMSCFCHMQLIMLTKIPCENYLGHRGSRIFPWIICYT